MDKPEKIQMANYPPEKIKEWVEKQGYSLEMRVARKFKDFGFQVSQFEHFVDQESNSVRPVDVVATLSKEFENAVLNFKLFIECKYAKLKPWVILVTPQKFDKNIFFSRVLDNQRSFDWKNLPTLQGRLVAILLQVLGKKQKGELFSITNIGYIVREVNLTEKQDPNHKDIAYEATVQVSKSVEAQDLENENFYQESVASVEADDSEFKTSEPKLHLLLSIVIPIVVINGQLFESRLGDNNEPEIREVGHGYILVPRRRKENAPRNHVSLSTVTIVTEQSLDKYIEEFKASIDDVLNQDDAIRELVNHECSQLTKLSASDIDF